MKTNDATVALETPARYWRRVLRPLLWWLLLVLAMFAYHQHQEMMEHTRIDFSVSISSPSGNQSLFGELITLDSGPVASGQKISLGYHTFKIDHPKTESFTTNFFCWYGGKNFGVINVKRALAILNVVAKPAAHSITINGPEFSLTLLNSTGTNLLVPTDRYRVSAQFARCSIARDYDVAPGNTLPCRFEPPIGALSVSCREDPATYQLRDKNDQIVESGNVPAMINDLPGGQYRVIVEHNNHQLNRDIYVSGDKISEVPFHFVFGSARFESEPDGAMVYSADGHYLGTTPVTVAEITPGPADYQLRRSGYENATVTVTVSENNQALVSTNLISLAYIGNVRAAREFINAGNYRNALDALAQALDAQPGDPVALDLQTTAQGLELVQAAKGLANQGDYIAAGKKLQTALQTLPDDAEAKNLQASYKLLESDQIGQIKQKRTREVFDRVCQLNAVANLFDEHEVLSGTRSPQQARAGIVQNCEMENPTLKVTRFLNPEDDIYEITMVQSSQNPLIFSRREVLLVIGKGKANQTAVLFKVLEYRKRQTGNLADTLLSGYRAEDWIPVSPQRIQMTAALQEQIQAGVRMMLGKIKPALGVATYE